MVHYIKEKGPDNPADMLTKNVPRELLDKFCRILGLELHTDINEEGLKLGKMEKIVEDVPSVSNKDGLEPWPRTDLKSLCLQGTRQGGRSAETSCTLTTWSSQSTASRPF